MRTQIEDKKYYEKFERQIIKKAITMVFITLINREIKNEGLKDFAYCEMLRNQFAARQNYKK